MNENAIRRLGGERILNPGDIPDLNAACYRVLLLMSVGRWTRPSDIRLAAGNGHREASEGLRRLRELRPVLDRLGFVIERKRCTEERRTFLYRLARKEPPMGELF